MEPFNASRGCGVEIKVRVIDADPEVRDVVITTHAGATVGEVAELLWPGQPLNGVWCDDLLWSVGDRLVDCGVVHGAILRPEVDGTMGAEAGCAQGVVPPGSKPAGGARQVRETAGSGHATKTGPGRGVGGLVTVGVTGGYSAGVVADLPLGAAWIGSRADCAVHVPGLLAQACRLVVTMGGAISVHPEPGVTVLAAGVGVVGCGPGANGTGAAAGCDSGAGAGRSDGARGGVVRGGVASGLLPEGKGSRRRHSADSVGVGGDGAAESAVQVVGDGFAWHPGVRLRLGSSVLEILPREAALTPERADEAPVAEVLRPPRLLPPDPGGVFSLPKEPKKPAARSFPLILMLAPLLMAGVMIGVTGTWHYALFAILSPVMMAGSWLSGNAGARKAYRRELAEWRTNTTRITGHAAVAVRGEERARRFRAPDPATVAQAAAKPTGRLWERASDDPDFLQLRVGNANLPSGVTVEDPGLDAHQRKTVPEAVDVPAVVSLSERGVVGVCGHPDYARAVVTWWVAQCAVLHSPRLVWLYVLAESRRAAGWEWVKWLPHCVPMAGQNTQVTVGCGADAVARRFGELAQLIAGRTAYMQNNPGRGYPGPAVVVVWDGSRALRQHPAAIIVLTDGPAVGVFSVCVDEQPHHVPGQADAVVEVSDRAVATIRQQRADDIMGVAVDVVVPPWSERIALQLAGLRDAGTADQAMIADACRLLDVLGFDEPSVQQVLAEWSAGRPGTRVRLGEGLDGPFWVDIVADGPHALVAGTTGAGKSELLRTWLCSLAVASRPDELVFVLVDYKGGAAFAECSRLPHTVGLVTDLDSHLVRRCLVSLGAEITLREHLLAQAGASDVTEYQKRRRRDASLPPLPRLMLVIDEFAALVQELPEFVDGLIDIAQRGRSLGMHLVLATQRPAGVVSGPIRANTNLRLCLRVTNVGESQDVVDAPDAAAIPASLPGRCVARCGPAAVQQFQTARISAPVRDQQVSPVSGVAPFSLLAGNATEDDDDAERPTDDATTDLSMLVDVVGQAAEALGIESPRRPWLPELPPVWQAGPGEWAIRDEPARQTRTALTGDVSTWGHWFVIGAARSGRSHALRMMVAAAVQHHSVADLHVYGVDCGSGALGVLEQLPHCGAVVPRRDVDRLRRMLDVLTKQVRRRSDLLAQAGVGSWAELRAAQLSGAVRQPGVSAVQGGMLGQSGAIAPVSNGGAAASNGGVASQSNRVVQFGDTCGGFDGVAEELCTTGHGPSVDVGAPGHAHRGLPYIAVVIDRWEGWLASIADVDNGALAAQFAALLSDGPPVGVCCLISGDRALAAGKMAAATQDRLVLRLNDDADYALLGLASRDVPDAMPPGRAVHTGTGLEHHIGTLGEDPSGAAQHSEFVKLAAAVTQRNTSVPEALRPERLKVLPRSVTAQQVACWPDGLQPGPMRARCGVGADAVIAVGPDLGQHAVCAVAGPPRSGRSTLLALCATQMATAGGRLVVWAPRVSPLRALAETPGVAAVFTDPSAAAADLNAAVGGDPGTVLVVDDADLLRTAPAATWLADYLRGARDRGQGALVAGLAAELSTGLSGWPAELRRSRYGLLTAVTSLVDGDLVGVRVTRSMVVDAPTLGRAYFHDGSGSLTPIVFSDLD